MQAELKIAALKAVNLFASKEETRYYLCGVLVQISLRHTLYVATDGHRMLVHREDLAEGAEANTLLGDFILPRAALDKLKAAKSGPAEIFFSTFAEGKFLLGETVVTPIDGSFPDWRRVCPAPQFDTDAPAPSQINLRYGASFADAAVMLGCQVDRVVVHHAGAGNPCAVTFGPAQHTFGVIMALRDPAPLWAGVPEWAKAAPASAPEAVAAE